MRHTPGLSSRRSWRRAAVLGVACLVPALLTARGDDPKSAAAAKELVQALEAAKLEAIAAADPASPGTFVAALYIADSQFLVVSAKYAAPALLNDKITKKDYRDVYIDLTSASVAGTKVFVQDQGPNGLQAKSDPPDSWEEGGKSLNFDGDYKKAKISEADYQKSFADADERYAKILALLVASAKGKS